MKSRQLQHPSDLHAVSMCDQVLQDLLYLRPTIHAACHDNLWYELRPSRRGLPLFQQRQEGECKPVWAYCIGTIYIIEIVL
jgi:hypothetical protein